MESQCPSGTSTCPDVGASTGCRCVSAPEHGAPPSPTDHGVCRVVSFMHARSSLLAATTAKRQSLSSLKDAITEVLPLSLISLALASTQMIFSLV